MADDPTASFSPVKGDTPAQTSPAINAAMAKVQPNKPLMGDVIGKGLAQGYGGQSDQPLVNPGPRPVQQPLVNPGPRPQPMVNPGPRPMPAAPTDNWGRPMPMGMGGRGMNMLGGANRFGFNNPQASPQIGTGMPQMTPNKGFTQLGSMPNAFARPRPGAR